MSTETASPATDDGQLGVPRGHLLVRARAVPAGGRPRQSRSAPDHLHRRPDAVAHHQRRGRLRHRRSRLEFRRRLELCDPGRIDHPGGRRLVQLHARRLRLRPDGRHRHHGLQRRRMVLRHADDHRQRLGQHHPLGLHGGEPARRPRLAVAARLSATTAFPRCSAATRPTPRRSRSTWGPTATTSCRRPARPRACSSSASAGTTSSPASSVVDGLDGGAGKDKLTAGGGADDLYGESGRDKLKGGGGEDYLDGGKGRDKLWGGNDADSLHGGNGRDKFIVDQGRATRPRTHPTPSSTSSPART